MVSLVISNNPQLTSLQGSFPQAALAGPTARLAISGNTALTSLAGLEVRHSDAPLAAGRQSGHASAGAHVEPSFASLRLHAQIDVARCDMHAQRTTSRLVGLTHMISAATQGISSPSGSFSITGNPVLRNISALAGISQCSGGDAANTVNLPVTVQVLLSTGAGCSLTSWTGVCAYIAAYTGNPSVSSCPAS